MRHRLRRLALSWLPTDLASVRDKDAQEKLPAEEGDAWRKLWQDVNAVLAKAQEKR